MNTNSKENSSSWTVISLVGSVYSNQSGVLNALNRGDADSAKIVETVAEGRKYTAIFVNNYK